MSGPAKPEPPFNPPDNGGRSGAEPSPLGNLHGGEGGIGVGSPSFIPGSLPAAVSEERQEQTPRSNWGSAGPGPRQLDDWIRINTDSTVTALSGKVELGTGVRTALAQIVAEELDVPFDSVTMVMGDTERTPNEGFTAGSKTIQAAGVALRLAAAEARQALLELASEVLSKPIQELRVEDGAVFAMGDPFHRVTYGALMGGKQFERVISNKAPLKRPEEYRVVGQPIGRVDLQGKVTGAGSYVHDLRVAGMLHGRVIRPLRPGLRPASVDESSLSGINGLVGIIRKNAFLGVVCEREEEAVRAAEQLKVAWAEPEGGLAAIPNQSDLASFLQSQPTTDKIVEDTGGVDEALARGKHKLETTYSTPFQMHASIGPSCAVADVTPEGATVWASTQGVFMLRGSLAELLRLPEDKVHVVFAEGSGCYGHNGADDVAADAALMSQALGRPVRVQWMREDEHKWEPYGPAMVMKVQGALDASGNVEAWSYEAWSPTHASRAAGPGGMLRLLAGQEVTGRKPFPAPFFIGGDRNARHSYTFHHSRVLMHWLAGMPLRTSSMRSLGAFANAFAIESFVDELASAAGRDPVQFRFENLSDERAIAVIRSAAEKAGWKTKGRQSKPRNVDLSSALGSASGMGIAFAQYENEEAYCATVAEVEVHFETGQVRVKRMVVAHDCGMIINPNGLQNQIEGNVIQSTSRAIKEAVHFGPDGIQSVDWDTYPILTFPEIPDIDIVLINRPDKPAVGAGEPATVPTAAAIANAIFDATGARVRSVPFTSERVKEALAAG